MRCLDEVRAPGSIELSGLDHVDAVWRHEGVVRDLVLRLKLGGGRTCAEPLIDGLVQALHRSGTSADAVTWPPCSRADKRRRGFDHAELLGRGVAAALGLPASPLLRRAIRVADQAGLSGEDRRINLVGAFGPAAPSPGRVLLVDDVVTTGATLRACAEILTGAGAAHVEAFAACSAFS